MTFDDCPTCSTISINLHKAERHLTEHVTRALITAAAAEGTDFVEEQARAIAPHLAEALGIQATGLTLDDGDGDPLEHVRIIIGARPLDACEVPDA